MSSPVVESRNFSVASLNEAVVMYHNPNCGTSRNVLGILRHVGIEPIVIEYLKTPPSRVELVAILERLKMTPRALLRRKGTPYEALGLDDPSLTDSRLIDAMLAHPILIERPIVITPLGIGLCRPSEAVLPLLPRPMKTSFRKEDGEVISIPSEAISSEECGV
ncbi:arsenate reductase (glutaredoxin) [Azospirillaceae bacterium]